MRQTTTARIQHDLLQLVRNPIDGVVLHTENENDDLFTHHVSIRIVDGIYNGVIIHAILRLPGNYPHTAPSLNIAAGHAFDHRFHSHVYGGGSICNDMLSNFQSYFQSVDGSGRAPPAAVGSGWSPGMTISAVLLQTQTFLADPDRREMSVMPTAADIDRLHATLRTSYKCNSCKKSYTDLIRELEVTKTAVREKPVGHFDLEADNVTCAVTKENLYENPDMLLGYPLKIQRKATGKDGFSRFQVFPVLELMSYDAYMSALQAAGDEKLDNFTDVFLKSVTGHQYNCWMPLYLNANHMQKGRSALDHAISVMYRGDTAGTESNDFKPVMAVSVLSALLNTIVVEMMRGMYESRALIHAYCHVLRLFMYYLDAEPSVRDFCSSQLNAFCKSADNRTKRHVPDLGQFIILTYVTRAALQENSTALPPNHVFHGAFMEEFLTRQILWIEKSDRTFFTTAVRSEPSNYAKAATTAFTANKTALLLMIFNIAAAKTFINPTAKSTLDTRFGYPPEAVVTNFQRTIVSIKEVTSYVTALGMLGAQHISEPKHVVDKLRRCKLLSDTAGYTGVNTQANTRTRGGRGRGRGRAW